jgi:hypothetical protein
MLVERESSWYFFGDMDAHKDVLTLKKQTNWRKMWNYIWRKQAQQDIY